MVRESCHNLRVRKHDRNGVHCATHSSRRCRRSLNRRWVSYRTLPFPAFLGSLPPAARSPPSAWRFRDSRQAVRLNMRACNIHVLARASPSSPSPSPVNLFANPHETDGHAAQASGNSRQLRGPTLTSWRNPGPRRVTQRSRSPKPWACPARRTSRAYAVQATFSEPRGEIHRSLSDSAKLFLRPWTARLLYYEQPST